MVRLLPAFLWWPLASPGQVVDATFTAGNGDFFIASNNWDIGITPLNQGTTEYNAIIDNGASALFSGTGAATGEVTGLTLSLGSALTLSTGDHLTVEFPVTLAAGFVGTLNVDGDGALFESLAVNNALDNVRLNALRGGEIRIPATSYAIGSVGLGSITLFSSDGTNSLIDLSTATNLTVGERSFVVSSLVEATNDGTIDLSGTETLQGPPSNDLLTFHPATGGVIDFGSLTAIPNSRIVFDIDVPAYTLPALTSAQGASYSVFLFDVAAGSQLNLPSLTSYTRGRFAIGTGGSVLASNLTSFTESTLALTTNQTLDVPPFTDVTSSLFSVSTGVTFAVAAATYVLENVGMGSVTALEADGPGAVLDFSSVTNLSFPSRSFNAETRVRAENDGFIDLSGAMTLSGPPGDDLLAFELIDGGVIDLGDLATITDSRARFDQDVPAFALPSLQTATGVDYATLTFDVDSFSELSLPQLTTLSRGRFTIADVARVDAPLLTEFTRGNLTLNGVQFLDAPPFTNFDNSQILISGGKTFAVAATGYRLQNVVGGDLTLFEAAGAGTLLDFQSITNITVEERSFDVDTIMAAVDRGVIDVTGATTLQGPTGNDEFEVLAEDQGDIWFGIAALSGRVFLTARESGRVSADALTVATPSQLTVLDRGRVAIAERLTLNGAPVFVNTGSTLGIGSGTPTLKDTVTVFADGALQGAGTIDADVVAGGRVEPGLSTGILTVNGGYTQTAEGDLVIEIEGPGAGTGFDRLDVAGPASLDGALRLVFTTNDIPGGGSFEILAATSLGGTFSATNRPNAGAGVDVAVVYSSTNVVVQVTVGPATDTDGDGLSDSDETTIYTTLPGTADSDGDSLSDGDEVHVYGTHPKKPDSDGDNLDDDDELLVHGTDPNESDTDGDGSDDDVEIAAGTDPLDSQDFPGSGPELAVTDTSGFVDDLTVQFAGTPVASTSGLETFSLRNAGNQSLSVSNLVLGGSHAGEFTITVRDDIGAVVGAADFAIPVGETYTIDIQFMPSNAAARAAQIDFDTDDPDGGEASVTLHLEGLAILSAAQIVPARYTGSGGAYNEAPNWDIAAAPINTGATQYHARIENPVAVPLTETAAVTGEVSALTLDLQARLTVSTGSHYGVQFPVDIPGILEADGSNAVFEVLTPGFAPDNSRFEARNGGRIAFPAASYSLNDVPVGGDVAAFLADGANSRLDFSTLPSLVFGPRSFNSTTRIRAVNGGVIDFSNLLSLTAASVGGDLLSVELSDGGFIDFASLESIPDGWLRLDVDVPGYALPSLVSVRGHAFSGLQIDVASNSVLDLPQLQEFVRGTLIIADGGTIHATNLLSFTESTLDLTSNRTLNVPPFTAIDSSLYRVTTGATFTVAADSYVINNVGIGSVIALQADGAGALLDFSSVGTMDFPARSFNVNTIVRAENDGMIDLSGVTTITGPPGTGDRVYLEVRSGGSLDLDNLATVPAGNLTFDQDVPSYALPALQTAAGTDYAALIFDVVSFGTLHLPQLTALHRSRPVIRDVAVVEAPLLTSFTSGILELNGVQFLNAPPFTAIDSSQIRISGGKTFAVAAPDYHLQNVVGGDLELLSASGVGTLLDLSSLAALTIDERSFAAESSVTAVDGGTVDLRGVTTVDGPDGNDLFRIIAEDGGHIEMGTVVILDRSIVNVGQSGVLVADAITANAPGQVTVADAGTLSIRNQLTLDGAPLTVSGGGAVAIGAGGAPVADTVTVFPGGVLTAGATVHADLVNAGVVAPGASAGTLVLNGDYRQEADGVLAIEVAGLSPGTEFDVLDVSGDADLGGAIRLDFATNDIVAGGTFEILRCGSLSGAFSETNRPNVGAGVLVDVVYGPTGVSVQVAYDVVPDADGDGLSDADETTVHGTLPGNPDSDGDNLSDGDEIHVHGTNPVLADSDGDNLDDDDEILVHGTDPNATDTDSDGTDDDVELAAGTDPLDPDDFPGSGPELDVADTSGFVDDRTVAFPGVPIGGSSDTETFTLANIGNESLAVSNVIIVGSATQVFSFVIKDHGGSPVAGTAFAIGTGETFAVETTYAPTNTGGQTAQITFDTNDPDGGENAVGLVLEGLAIPGSGTPIVEARYVGSGQAYDVPGVWDVQTVPLNSATNEYHALIENAVTVPFSSLSATGDVTGLTLGLDTRLRLQTNDRFAVQFPVSIPGIIEADGTGAVFEVLAAGLAPDNARFEARNGGAIIVPAATYALHNVPLGDIDAFVADGDGSLLDFSTMQSFTLNPRNFNVATRIRAANNGLIDFSGVTSLRGASASGDLLEIELQTGGTIDLSSLATIPDGWIALDQDIPDYTLPSLANAAGYTFGILNLDVTTNATLNLPVLTTFTRGTFTLADGAAIQAPLLTSFRESILNLTTNSTVGAPLFTDITSSTFSVGPGRAFDVATGAYTMENVGIGDVTAFEATGTNARLNFQSITNLSFPSRSFNVDTRIRADDGGVIDLSGIRVLAGPASDAGDRILLELANGGDIVLTNLTTIAGGRIVLDQDVPAYSLPLLEEANGIGYALLTFDVAEAATLQLPELDTLRMGAFALGDGAVVQAPKLTTFTRGLLNISTQNLVNAPLFTDITSSSFHVFTGRTFEVAATAYLLENAGVPDETYLSATGPGAVLDLGTVTNLTVVEQSFAVVRRIRADDHGVVDLSGLQTFSGLSGNDTHLFRATGDGRIILGDTTFAGITRFEADAAGVISGGVLRLTGPAAVALTGAGAELRCDDLLLNGSATIDVFAFANLHVNGTLDLGAGTAIDLSSPGSLGVGTCPQSFEQTVLEVCADGTLAGSGSLAGHLVSAGVVAPGSPTGAIDITGAYTQAPSGTLVIEINGTNQSGRINTTGEADLDGALVVNLGEDYVPRFNDEIVILSAASRTGTFATVTLPTVWSETVLAVDYRPDAVAILVIAAPDTDGDGLPNWWEETYYGNPTNAAPTADDDGDGKNNTEELISGTVPTNANSVIRIEFVDATPAQVGIGFDTVPLKFYTIEYADDITATGLPWTGFANTNDTIGTYRESGSATNFIFLDDFGPGTSGGPPANGNRAYRIDVRDP